MPAAASLLLAVPPVVAHADESAPPSPDAGASLAGRPAGEGRERPGRPTGPEVSRPGDPPSADASAPSGTRSSEPSETRSPSAPATESVAPVVPLPDVPLPDAARRPDPQAVGKSSERPVPVLTLGTGITLFGLGLGFLGLRLRRR